MEKLYIAETPKTPRIECNPDGNIIITGRSLPEDAAGFYFPVVEWLSDYYRSPATITNLLLDVDYINSASASMLSKLCFVLERLSKYRKQEVHVKWIVDHDDDDMIDMCKDMSLFYPALHTTIDYRTERFKWVG